MTKTARRGGFFDTWAMPINHVVCEDITKYKHAEAIIAPANCRGLVTTGLGKKLNVSGGSELRNKLELIYSNNKFEIGSSFNSHPGRMIRMGYKTIYHAVIKEYNGSMTSLFFIGQALSEIIRKCQIDEISSIAIPGLGLDAGIDSMSAASLIVRMARSQGKDINIHIVDENEEFIEHVRGLLGVKDELPSEPGSGFE